MRVQIDCAARGHIIWVELRSGLAQADWDSILADVAASACPRCLGAWDKPTAPTVDARSYLSEREIAGEPLVDVLSRDSLIRWLAWNDPNGSYADDDRAAEGEPPAGLGELWLHFAEQGGRAPLRPGDRIVFDDDTDYERDSGPVRSCEKINGEWGVSWVTDAGEPRGDTLWGLGYMVEHKQARIVPESRSDCLLA